MLKQLKAKVRRRRLKNWRCEVEGKFFILPFQLTGDSLEQGFITPIPGCEFPKGSVMVKKVKLTDLVWGVR